MRKRLDDLCMPYCAAKGNQHCPVTDIARALVYSQGAVDSDSLWGEQQRGNLDLVVAGLFVGPDIPVVQASTSSMSCWVSSLMTRIAPSYQLMPAPGR